MKFPLICIVGPTASGKTDAAFHFSKLLPSEILSCDSMQIYKHMPVLTQAPSKEFCKKIKTHLVCQLEPSAEFSAAQFRESAQKLIPDILGKRKLPLIVGGTGLYLRALLDGLFESAGESSPRDESLRQELIALEEDQPGELHRQLSEADPASAKKIHPNDVRRLVRALEVYRLTGSPMSVQKPNRKGVREIYDTRIFLVNRDRKDLYARINLRVDQMLSEGLIEEVQTLRKKKLSKTAEVALGYREIGSYLDGKISLEAAVETLKKNTRNYAKRQLSWFRHEKEVEMIEIEPGESGAETAVKIFQKWGAKK